MVSFEIAPCHVRPIIPALKIKNTIVLDTEQSYFFYLKEYLFKIKDHFFFNG